MSKTLENQCLTYEQANALRTDFGNEGIRILEEYSSLMFICRYETLSLDDHHVIEIRDNVIEEVYKTLPTLTIAEMIKIFIDKELFISTILLRHDNTELEEIRNHLFDQLTEFCIDC